MSLYIHWTKQNLWIFQFYLEHFLSLPFSPMLTLFGLLVLHCCLKNYYHCCFKKSALAGVVQWIECWPVNWGVTCLVPSQGTCLGCGLGPWLGACKRQPRINVSLPLFLPPSPLSKNKTNKNLLKNQHFTWINNIIQ